MLINQTLEKLHSMRLTGWPRLSPSNSKIPTPPFSASRSVSAG